MFDFSKITYLISIDYHAKEISILTIFHHKAYTSIFMHYHILQVDYIRMALETLQRLDLVDDFSLKTLV